MAAAQHKRRQPLDPEPLSLGRRAAYRRVLALVGSQPTPWTIGGAIGLSLQLGHLVDGQLEIYQHAQDVPESLAAIAAAGIKVERDDANGAARITYGEQRALIRWALPPPLLGEIDDAWLIHGRRTRFLGIRVRVAPVEELLWLRVAQHSGASLGDPLISQLLLSRGEHLDWQRLLARMTGLEALLLAHIFLFWHRYPESARTLIPPWVLASLRERLEGFDDSAILDSMPDPRRVEQSLAEQSLHGGR